mmetsp:Transcript_32651/g.33297  ORF Transcript_32651/g.33297 Transcript_32651/m.33297 type:complete len:475 (-) Transcript_32651:138-1562(-)
MSFGATAFQQSGSFGATGFGGNSAGSGFGTSVSKPSGFGTSLSGGFGQQSTGTTGFGATSATTPKPNTGFGTFGGTSFGGSSFQAGSSGFGTSSNVVGSSGLGQSGFDAGSQKRGFGGFGTQPTTTGFGGTGTQSTAAGFGGLGTPYGGTGMGGGMTNFGSSFGSTGSTGLGLGMTQSVGNIASTPVPGQGGQDVLGYKILEYQRVYASYIDATGRVQSDTPSGAPSVPGAAGATQVIPNPFCQFDTIVYNYISNPQQPAVRPSQVSYQRWRQAELDNPNSQLFEPCLLIGPAALKKRFESQQTTASEHSLVVQDITKTLNMCALAISKTEKRVEVMRGQQAKLRYKLLNIMSKVEVLRCRGVYIDHNERKFGEQLERLLSEMRGPQTVLQQLIFLQEQLIENIRDTNEGIDNLDETDLTAVYHAIQRQQQGIQHISNIIQKDIRDMSIMKEKLTDVASNPSLRHAVDEFYSRI